MLTHFIMTGKTDGSLEGSLKETDGSINALFAQDAEQLEDSVLAQQRMEFVQRNRDYLGNGVINEQGRLTDEALFHIAEQRGFDFLKNAKCYMKRRCYLEVLEVAARNSVEHAPWEVLKHAYLFDGQPWEEEVVMAATEKCPPILTKQFADRIKNDELRKKVLVRVEELLKKNSKK